MFYEILVTRVAGELRFKAKDLDGGNLLAILIIPDGGEFPKLPAKGLCSIKEGETPLAAIESLRQTLINIKGLARRQEPVTC
jgi:hypothetical protein